MRGETVRVIEISNLEQSLKELLKIGVNEDAEKKAKEDIKKDESEDSELKKIK